MSPRWFAATLVTILALVQVAGTAEATPADVTGTTARPAPRLIDRTPWVTDVDDFRLRVEHATAARVVATVHREVIGIGGSSTFAEQLDGGAELGSTVGEPIDLRAESDASWALALDNDQLGIQVGGVYPIEITALDDTGSELGRLVTHLAYDELAGSFEPLRVALSLDGSAPTAHQRDGSTDLEPESEARLAMIADAATANPEVPFLLTVAPETLDATPSEVVDALAAADAYLTAGQPWAGLDLGSWLAEPRSQEVLEQQIDRGTAAVARTGIDTTPVQVLETAVTAARRSWLALGQPRLLVPDNADTPGVPQPVTGTDAVAIGTDPLVQRSLESIDELDDSTLAVHHALAGLAARYFERPAQARALHMSVSDPGEFGPAALEQLLEALGPNSVATAVEPTEPFTRIEPGDEELALALRPASDLNDYLDGLDATRRILDSWQAMLIQPDERGRRLSEDLDATAAVDRIEQAGEWFADAVVVVAGQTEGLVLPERQTVTITDRDATLPIRVENALGYRATVQLSFESPRLDFTEADQDRVLIELDEGTNIIDIPVRARSSGAFPVQISVTSPDGRLALAEEGFRVRSTVFSGVGLILSAGAMLVLAVWWARVFRRGRRDHRLVERSTTPEEN